MIKGKPDEIEPDGAPNPAGKPRSTLQFNIWYHLALSHYLQGNYAKAYDAQVECMKVSNNDDSIVATSDWMWMTLMRLNRKADAAKVLERITPKMDILENQAYHRRLLMYKGVEKPDALLDTASPDPTQIATQGYGVANYYLVTGDTARARAGLRTNRLGRGLERFRFHRRRSRPSAAEIARKLSIRLRKRNRCEVLERRRRQKIGRFSVAVALHLCPAMPASNPIRIGVACPIPGERAAFLEWLGLAGYEPIPMLSIDGIGRDLTTRPIEALIADVELVPKAELPRVARTLGANRPLLLVGNPEAAIEEVPRDAAWIDRPVTRDAFLLAVALALAEGRPARRSPRTLVPQLMSSIDGVSSTIMDVSQEGVRLEISGATPSALPPYFTLKVPGFGVAAKVKRVWVAMPAQGSMWCGGVLEQPERKTATIWNKFIAAAPRGGQKIFESRS